MQATASPVPSWTGDPSDPADRDRSPRRPGLPPEHTAASFELAIDLGAELIEPDVVLSRDGALIVRHESELSWSTDVSDRPEFASRRTTKLIERRTPHGLVRRGLHAGRAAHAARRRADARAAPAQQRLRRPLRHPHARRGHRAGPLALHRRAPDPRARGAQAGGRASRRPADGGADQRRAAPARVDDGRRLRRPPVLRLRRAARAAQPARRRRAPDGAARRRHPRGRPDGHPGRAAGDLDLRPGDRPQPRPVAAFRRSAGRRHLRPRRRGPPRRTLRSSAGRCAPRTRFLPSTCAAARPPRPTATRSARPACCSTSASTG